jgi:hypothetical protein
MAATVTFEPTEAMIREAYAAFNASLPGIQNVTGISWALNLEPLLAAGLHTWRRRHQRARPDEQRRTLARRVLDIVVLVGRRPRRAGVCRGVRVHGRYRVPCQEARCVRPVYLPQLCDALGLGKR